MSHTDWPQWKPDSSPQIRPCGVSANAASGMRARCFSPAAPRLPPPTPNIRECHAPRPAHARKPRHHWRARDTRRKPPTPRPTKLARHIRKSRSRSARANPPSAEDRAHPNQAGAKMAVELQFPCRPSPRSPESQRRTGNARVSADARTSSTRLATNASTRKSTHKHRVGKGRYDEPGLNKRQTSQASPIDRMEQANSVVPRAKLPRGNRAHTSMQTTIALKPPDTAAQVEFKRP